MLANDTDADDGTALTADLVDRPGQRHPRPSTPTAHSPTPPNANFNGTDTFTYQVTDGATDSNTATVTITVNAVNDAPVAVDDDLHRRRGHPADVPAASWPTTPTPTRQP